MKHHGKKRSRGVSGLEREAEREELRKIRSRRAFGYAGRIHARLPERLQRARLAAGLSRYGLEQRSGISREMIGKIERGKTKRPSLYVVTQLCYGAGMSLWEFVGLIEEMWAARLGPH
jgi:ribosome-binding protein aMBF1 (putative translation factor)